MKLKIGVAVLALICAGGGYVAWSQLFANKTAPDGPEQEGAETAQTEEPNHLGPDAASLESGDPFDDMPAVRPAANSRPLAAAEPRRMGGNADDATPIRARNAAAARSKKNPLRESLDLDDDEPLDLSEDTALQEVPPSERGAENPASVPSLGGAADQPRRRTAAGPADAAATRLRGPQASPGSGPRFSAGGDDDAKAADDLSDEKLDGYRVVETRTSGNTRGTTGAPAISIVEADDDSGRDEKLDGYVPQDVTAHRARSTTLVVRATDADREPANVSEQSSPATRREAAPRSTEFGGEEGLDDTPPAGGVDDGEPFARPAREAVNAIQRRSSPPAMATDRRFQSKSPSTGAAAQRTDPAGDTYRVAPDDNFWKISRKQYGTARYYQALMRYNQDRVPDPQKLRPGTQILTPPAAVLEKRFPDLIEKPAAGAAPDGRAVDRSAMRPGFEQPFADDDAIEPAGRTSRETGSSGYFYGKSGEPMFRIGADDTLTGIAQRHLGRASRWQEIYDKNQDVLQSPDNLTPGTVIRLPLDASRVSLAPDSDRRR
ncbi:MAG: LysM peptidoglycan-binding domain-containing protein [Deltaproteobacteria bacterium]